MKNTTIVCFAISAASVVAAFGATSSGSNLVGFDDTTSPIVDNSGTPIASGTGFAAFGTLALTDNEIQTFFTTDNFQGIQDAFVAVGSAQFGAGIDAAGLYATGSQSDAAISSGAIYTVIGNRSTIAGSDQILVAVHSASFVADPAISDSATLSNTSGNVDRLVVGEFGNFTADFGAGAVDAYNLVAIPEPSTSLLAALAGLALVGRRRR